MSKLTSKSTPKSNLAANITGIVSGKCPKCRKGNIFQDHGDILKIKMPRMHSHCSECNYTFEKEPGYFVGSMYVSYALAVAELMAVFIALAYFLNVYLIMVIMLVILLLLSFFNFRYSRIIWIYIFQS
ncbi:MAG: DUF983 domain-containing protein [Crocinitomicaceae bacterium]|nr:DUF983 domain-containing protein [Crocinitomicaceae bacterium]